MAPRAPEILGPERKGPRARATGTPEVSISSRCKLLFRTGAALARNGRHAERVLGCSAASPAEAQER